MLYTIGPKFGRLIDNTYHYPQPEVDDDDDVINEIIMQ